MANFDSHKNFIATVIQAAPSPSTTGTTLTVISGSGAIFPATPFNCIVYPAGIFPNTLNTEVIRVTAVVSDTLTVTRAQEGSTARSILSGDIIALTVTAKSLTDIEAAINATTGNAAADGSTKGISTFLASDFNSSSGLISIDYTNAQAASSSNKGFLTNTDWSTFNAKQTALGYTPVNSSLLGAANGVATLDSSSKLSTSQIPTSLLGSIEYQGSWNANTNSPTLVSSTGTKGFYYVVSTAGSTTLDGISGWNIGDWAIFNGSIWQKVDNNNLISSVNGFTGTVVLNSDNINEGSTNLYFLQSRARSTISATAPIGYNSSTGVISITQSTTSVDGYLSHTDWNTFNNKQSTITSGNVTETGSSILTIIGGTGAILGSGVTLQVAQSSASTNGYLSSLDWSTFNAKQAALTPGNLTEATSSVLTITGGTGVLLSSASVQVKQSSTSQSGYLSSTDWNTFNNKQNALGFTPLDKAGSNSMTATLNIAPASNAAAIGITGYSLNSNNAQSLLDLAGTWNTSGAPTAIKLNITNTTSGSASKLIDLQIASSTIFSVDKAGTITSPGLTVSSVGALTSGGGNFTVAATGNTVIGGTLQVTGTSSFDNGVITTDGSGHLTLPQTGLNIKGASSNALTIKPNETLSSNKTLNIIIGDITRTLTFTSDATIGGTSSGTNTGDQTTVGTSNRVTVTNGSTSPIIDISSSYVGQSTITTLGTIATGTWHGSVIAEIYGGTNQSTYTLGDVLYSSAANTLSKLAGNTTSTKKFFRQTGNGTISAAPAWDTVTQSDVGLSLVENTALSTWAGTTNITTLGTIGTGVWNGTTITELHGGTNQTAYTLGDILYSSATNTLSKLSGNTTSTRKFLRQTGNGTISASPVWDTLTSSDVTNALGFTPPDAASIIRNTVDITSGVSTGSVTGLGLAFTPVTVLLTIEMPSSSGENLFATLIGDPTSDGFSYSLNAATDVTGYKLHYLILK